MSDNPDFVTSLIKSGVHVEGMECAVAVSFCKTSCSLALNKCASFNYEMQYNRQLRSLNITCSNVTEHFFCVVNKNLRDLWTLLTSLLSHRNRLSSTIYKCYTENLIFLLILPFLYKPH